MLVTAINLGLWVFAINTETNVINNQVIHTYTHYIYIYTHTPLILEDQLMQHAASRSSKAYSAGNKKVTLH